jgi:predicted AAA+ superfamily ATPase
MFHRVLSPGKSNSFFLFGPRGTGKTTLLKGLFQPNEALFIDLLDPSEEDLFSRNPGELSARAAALPESVSWVVLDEIQRAPRLLDVVHKLIESSGRKFAMTGSSARKLRRGASNLLAGRAFIHYLHPLTHREIGESFDLEGALHWGTLPRIHGLKDPGDKEKYLRAYALTYIKEEITAEQVLRKLGPFRQFLEVAAQGNGKIINFSKIAEDVGVDTKTVQSYFSVLEDTLIGILLPPFHASIRKRQRSNPKFYFFDPGVKSALDRSLGIPLQDGTYAFGKAFEHFVVLEALRLSSYRDADWAFSYLRTKDDAEIDLVVERPGLPVALIEIKSNRLVRERDARPLDRFVPAFGTCEAFLWSRDPHPKKLGNVWCFPWEEGLRKLGL